MSSQSPSSSKEPETPVIVPLVSKDGIKFGVPMDVLNQSLILKEAISMTSSSSFEEDILVQVSGSILELILEWLTIHRGKEFIYVESAELPKKWELTAEDESFLAQIQLSQYTEMAIAAEYLQIPWLVEVLSQGISNHVGDKGPAELRDLFNIANDLNGEESAELEGKYGWQGQL